MIKINKAELRDLILDGISSKELNSKYDYSAITDMSYMFNTCSSLKTVPLFDTSNVTDMQLMSCFQIVSRWNLCHYSIYHNALTRVSCFKIACH